jgi:UDP-4-amino-4,6-dideoxy-N-acetyl-beta-L-altrosamine N-acetyltransferase
VVNLSFHPIAEETEEMWRLVLEWRNSPPVRFQMLDQSPIDWETHCRWIGSQKEPSPNSLARVAYGGGRPLGVISLNRIDRKQSHSDWGMYIGVPELRGRGFGNAMVDEILRWGFDEERLARLYTSVLSDNVAALGLYLKKGFRLEGNWRNHVMARDGRYLDLLWLGLQRAEWSEKRGQTPSSPQ